MKIRWTMNLIPRLSHFEFTRCTNLQIELIASGVNLGYLASGYVHEAYFSFMG